ncbi:MAG: ASKHA domain-containing protein [Anaerolineaceae bacterium]
MPEYRIDFQPIGTRVFTNGKESLLALAQKAGISIAALCGGGGVCGSCKIRCIDGELNPVQPEEEDEFSPDQIVQGWRLACMTVPCSDARIELPPESLTTMQRLQIDGLPKEIVLATSLHLEKFSLPAPDQDDLRADWERFSELFPNKSEACRDVSLSVLTQFSLKMREQDWSAVAVFNGVGEILGFLREDQDCYGVAVDVGTTKMAAFLVNLFNGKIEAKSASMNPQISYGEDVISRIAHANQGKSQQKTLQTSLVEGVNQLVGSLCASARVDPDQIMDFVVVGNTAVQHLFAGLPVRQLGEAPYVAAVHQALNFPAREVNLFGAPGACVYMPPNIAGFVGADHLAMLLASDILGQQGVVLALDIGTNTEVSLLKDGLLVSCSCASGPAFEGAHIHAGMRAAPGAIERAKFFDGDWHLATIDNQPAVGLCGSGILDVVAGLLESGQIDLTGRFTKRAARKVLMPQGDAIILVPAAKSGTGNEILITRGDIREIQLAKAAIRAGINALLRATETKAEEIDQFIVAGAFGTYLNLDSAVKIGMFPTLPAQRFQQIGNAAGAGALEMLLSNVSRKKAETILAKISYIELTTDPEFMSSYVDAIGFADYRKVV